jgi:hypothetical protein
MTKTDILLRKFIRETKKMLRDSGWCQGNFFDERGGACLVGAICVVRTKPGINATKKQYYKLERILNEVMGMNIELTTWNDMPGRKKSEVFALLDKAYNKIGGK